MVDSKTPTKIDAGNYKWVKKLRALPSDPKENDFLKPEYIEVNLNNSRKLMQKVSDLAESSKALASENELVRESFSGLEKVKKELDWLGK